MESINEQLKSIRLLVLDVDGVLTDGRLYFNEQGEALKVFNTLDGHGIKMLQNSGVDVAIITGRNNPAVAKRVKDLGIKHLYPGREDKLDALQELWQASGFNADNTAFMGDDWPDLLAMAAVKFTASVPNAADAVKKRAHWCSARSGGEGAVRELCELIMTAQGTLDSMLAPYIEGYDE
ncbi:MAG: HAD family hydrolase [Motiliproteus sp.]|nr:HAD family hydrolase [Motiliproteus sp.]MCW9051004.1 HAD family hydrolase [Motiliproteus sp.]